MVNERCHGHRESGAMMDCYGKGSDEATTESSVKFPHSTELILEYHVCIQKESKPVHRRDDTSTHGCCSATNIDQDAELAQLSIHKQVVHILVVRILSWALFSQKEK